MHLGSLKANSISTHSRNCRHANNCGLCKGGKCPTIISNIGSIEMHNHCKMAFCEVFRALLSWKGGACNEKDERWWFLMKWNSTLRDIENLKFEGGRRENDDF